ncbi:MAG: hypothetical protein EA397_17485, partial [Deltaproteobacteria bacterium]
PRGRDPIARAFLDEFGEDEPAWRAYFATNGGDCDDTDPSIVKDDPAFDEDCDRLGEGGDAGERSSRALPDTATATAGCACSASDSSGSSLAVLALLATLCLRRRRRA